MAKRRHLERAVQILREEFGKGRGAKKPDNGKPHRICKIILYGSIGRGDQKPLVDMTTGWRADYDLLVIVSDPASANPKYWESARQAIRLDESRSSRARHPVQFIVHDLADVNDQLRRGRPFFKDVRRDGIILYESSSAELAQSGDLSPGEERQEAQQYFEQWFQRSLDFSENAEFNISKKKQNLAAFHFHQALESAYVALILCYTMYSNKEHDLEKLRSMAEGIEPRLIEAWPRKHHYQRRPFERLQRAYVDARYSPHYEITAEDLTYAAEHVAQLQAIVREVCEERLAATPSH